jgi:hypothetical protein
MQSLLMGPFEEYLEEFQAGVGKESETVLAQLQEAARHYAFPYSRQARIEDKFNSLVKTWRHDVSFKSSVTEMAINPHYQQIIGMGPAIIPLLLRELEERPDHWFWALRAITGIDPVKPEERGKMKLMAKAWLQWAHEQGYKW